MKYEKRLINGGGNNIKYDTLRINGVLKSYGNNYKEFLRKNVSIYDIYTKYKPKNLKLNDNNKQDYYLKICSRILNNNNCKQVKFKDEFIDKKLNRIVNMKPENLINFLISETKITEPLDLKINELKLKIKEYYVKRHKYYLQILANTLETTETKEKIKEFEKTIKKEEFNKKEYKKNDWGCFKLYDYNLLEKLISEIYNNSHKNFKSDFYKKNIKKINIKIPKSNKKIKKPDNIYKLKTISRIKEIKKPSSNSINYKDVIKYYISVQLEAMEYLNKLEIYYLECAKKINKIIESIS